MTRCCLVIALTLLLFGVGGAAADADDNDRAFPETRFRVADDFAEYFLNHGGIANFGYPVSREFVLRGAQVQLFQRTGLQLAADGSVHVLNLLDNSLLPYTRIDGGSLPPADPALVLAPTPGQTGYSARLAEFVRATVPDWMQTSVDVEVWGAPTSPPVPDAANPQRIFQRFEHGVFVHDTSCSCSGGVLLGDYLKALLTGERLPVDLATEARDSPLLRQYDPTKPDWLSRPAALPNTDLSDAFTPDI
jgi:hypothetical protein